MISKSDFGFIVGTKHFRSDLTKFYSFFTLIDIKCLYIFFSDVYIHDFS